MIPRIFLEVKIMKKVLAILLAVALIATLSISAVITASAGNDPTLVVSTETATKGATKDITISMVNNPGVASLKLSLTFPSDLTLNSVAYNAGLGGQSQAPAKLTSPVTLNWFNGGANTNGDMVYATLNFTVSNEATEGDKAIEISYKQDNVYNIDEEDVVFGITNGKITVVGCLHEHTTQVPAVPSTCKTKGHGAYTKCDDCGAIIEGSDAELDLADHTPGAATKENVVDATCAVAGSYTEVIKCTVCGETISSETKEIKATGNHTAGDWKSDSGAHWKECTVCKQVIGESESHDFEEKILEEATTEKEGKKANVCKVCGYVDEESTVTIPKLVSYDVEQTAGKTEENEAVYDADDAKAVAFTAKFAKDKLTAVKVNGQVVDPANYDVAADDQGNAVVTFKEDYLKTLGNGDYTVAITTDDGVAQTTLTVKNNAAAATTDTANGGSPVTGDNNIALLIALLLAVMAVSVGAGFVYRRRKEND